MGTWTFEIRPLQDGSYVGVVNGEVVTAAVKPSVVRSRLLRYWRDEQRAAEARALLAKDETPTA